MVQSLPVTPNSPTKGSFTSYRRHSSTSALRREADTPASVPRASLKRHANLTSTASGTPLAKYRDRDVHVHPAPFGINLCGR